MERLLLVSTSQMYPSLVRLPDIFWNGSYEVLSQNQHST